MVQFKKDKKNPLSEINIIPFTDILLVILIAFMVTTPLLLQSSIKVKLPKYGFNSPMTQDKKENQVKIVITQDGKLFLNDAGMDNLAQFESALKNLSVKDKIVVVNADKSTSYGLVAKVLSIAQAQGAMKLELAIQNQPDDSGNP
jgi:biopolymer transport protein ExbD